MGTLENRKQTSKETKISLFCKDTFGEFPNSFNNHLGELYVGEFAIETISHKDFPALIIYKVTKNSILIFEWKCYNISLAENYNFIKKSISVIKNEYTISNETE